MVRYFEDIEVGESYEHGSVSVTEADIIAFAEQYDPQPYHTDPEAAEATAFDGLAASGWHTAALCMRLLVDVLEEMNVAAAGARGVDELRWIKPVRPGDTLSIEVEVADKYPDEDDPAIGHADIDLTGYNQDGDAVISWIGLGMFERRDGE